MAAADIPQHRFELSSSMSLPGRPRLDCQDDGIAKHTLPFRRGTESSGTSVPATELTQHKYSFVREG